MSRFDQLLTGYLRNTLTDAELEEFLDLLKQNPGLQWVRDHEFKESHAGLTDPAQRQRMLANIQAQAKAQAQTHQLAQTPAQSKRIPLWRWSAAAAVLLLLVGALIILQPGSKQPVAKAINLIQYKNDVAPGKTGATLQLADGSTLTLDSLSPGVIARQGNTQVIRQANGAVAYHSSPQSSNAAERNTAVQYNKVSTGKGRQFQLVLPDGTKVWLNSSSSLTYPTAFNTHQRQVEITGEAYFEVARDASKPFVVKASRQDIQVLGTQFNVNTYDDEPVKRTTLLQGSIRITAAARSTLLTPGEAAAIDHNGTRMQVNPANVEAAVAWKNGFFQFDNADLPTVMRQLARWYDVEVKYEGRIPEYNDFKGQIGRDLTLAQVLKILEQTRVHFRIEQDKRILIFP